MYGDVWAVVALPCRAVSCRFAGRPLRVFSALERWSGLARLLGCSAAFDVRCSMFDEEEEVFICGLVLDRARAQSRPLASPCPVRSAGLSAALLLVAAWLAGLIFRQKNRLSEERVSCFTLCSENGQIRKTETSHSAVSALRKKLS